VNSVADLMGEAHLWSRGDLVRCADPELGEVVVPGVMPLLSETPGRITGWSRAPGSDNDAVLGELLGYATDRIRRVTEVAPAEPA
jgi:crotonobetainyl-CoA:carnitine CoA-transferase CaiB-like acyl-CoA transferase